MRYDHCMAYHLVQRCKNSRGAIDPSRGFDGSFKPEYMGSAEFEFNALPQSLKRMRTANDLVRKHRDVTIDGVTRKVFFVGSHATLKAKVDQFQEWAAQGFRGKESTWFPENFTGRDRFADMPVSDWMAETVLWWALNEDVMFTLDQATADRALAALTGERPTAGSVFAERLLS